MPEINCWHATCDMRASNKKTAVGPIRKERCFGCWCFGRESKSVMSGHHVLKHSPTLFDDKYALGCIRQLAPRESAPCRQQLHSNQGSQTTSLCRSSLRSEKVEGETCACFSYRYACRVWLRVQLYCSSNSSGVTTTSEPIIHPGPTLRHQYVHVTRTCYEAAKYG